MTAFILHENIDNDSSFYDHNGNMVTANIKFLIGFNITEETDTYKKYLKISTTVHYKNTPIFLN